MKSLALGWTALVLALAFGLGANAAGTSSANAATAPQPSASSNGGPVAPDYLIGPGDMLQVFVWRNPELSVTVPVRPDGKISTPLVEDMVAVGKTPSVLARDIEQRLSEYVRTPTVNVIVTQANSVFSQVRVVGEVRQPQNLPFREGMTVLDAILAVGGTTEFAATNSTKLVRDTEGKSVERRLRLGRILERGDLTDNVVLRPGDVIVVPQSMF